MIDILNYSTEEYKPLIRENTQTTEQISLLFEDIDQLIEEMKYISSDADKRKLCGLVLTVFNILRNIIQQHKQQKEESMFFGLTSKERNELKNEYPEEYKQFKKNNKKYYQKQTNYDWSYCMFYYYTQTNDLIMIKHCVRLLETALGRRIIMTARSGYQKNYRKISRNKYCAWSMELKHKDMKKELMDVMEHYDRKGYAIRMLTLAPKNIKKLESSDLENLQKVLKEFWRYTEVINKISGVMKCYKYKKYDCDNETYVKTHQIKYKYKKKKVFDMKTKINGYWGVPEVKYCNEKGYNVHYHFMILGSKRTGFINKEQLTRAWEKTCLKFGNDKIKGSFMKNIGAKHLKVSDKYGKEPWQKAVHYITKYVSKGIEIKENEDSMDSIKARITIMNSLKGRDMIKKGGLLKANMSNENIFRNITEKIINGIKSNLHKPEQVLIDNKQERLSIRTDYLISLISKSKEQYENTIEEVKKEYSNMFTFFQQNKENEKIYESVYSEIATQEVLRKFKQIRKKKVKICPITNMQMETSESMYSFEKYETDVQNVNERLRIINTCLEYVKEEDRKRFVTFATERITRDEFILSDLYTFSLSVDNVIIKNGISREVRA